MSRSSIVSKQGVTYKDNDPFKMDLRRGTKKHMEWRIESGSLEKLMPMLSEHPNLEQHIIVDEQILDF